MQVKNVGDRYRVEREDKAGEGWVDFIFYPECRGEDALILELKIDRTPEEAIRQIKDRQYAQIAKTSGVCPSEILKKNWRYMEKYNL